jgi:hypothetical protein
MTLTPLVPFALANRAILPEFEEETILATQSAPRGALNATTVKAEA